MTDSHRRVFPPLTKICYWVIQDRTFGDDNQFSYIDGQMHHQMAGFLGDQIW